MKNILLTGGRAPATLELARLFCAAGHRVFVAESVPWHLCRASRAVIKNFRVPPPNRQPAEFINALSHIARQEKIDLLVPTCEETFYVAMGREPLQPVCPVFTAPLPQLKRLHNKWDFIKQAQGYGLPVPETALVSRPEQALAYAGRPVVLKPVYSRFAAKTVILPHHPHDIPAQSITPQRPWVAQAFVSGRQLCTYSIVHAGKITAHSCYPAEFTAGPGAAIAFRPEGHPASFEWVSQFVAREKFTGQIAFDFIETDPGRVVALECNPRLTSGIHLFRDGPEVTRAFFDNSVETLLPSPRQAAMLALPMLLYGLPAALSQQRLSRWYNTFRGSRDAIFCRHDPMPALVMQWLAAAYLIYQSIRYRVGLVEASTLDIEWNGESSAQKTTTHHM